MGIIAFLIVGLVGGWLADELVAGDSFGLIGNLVIGVIGAFIGGFLMDLFGVETDGNRGLIFRILLSAVGAIIFLAIINFLF
jgi:uncharacterized membrane protein YeaQ/YmgE (transglycosylase-associated protein family)